MPPLTIVLTGPESTSKSTLSNQLAQHFNGIVIEEYARKYITELNRPYNYTDIEEIAKKQVSDYINARILNPGAIIFVDTYLIITKVWFEVVYRTFPSWIEQELLKSKIDLFLLCAPDLPWEKDDVRENGGEMRNWLFNEYEKNLIKFNFDYRIVEGVGNARLNCAIKHVSSFLSGRENYYS